jgi:hypothetical protein
MKYRISYWDEGGGAAEYILNTTNPLPNSSGPFNKTVQDQIADAIDRSYMKEWLDGNFAFFDWEEYTPEIEYTLEN